MPIQQLTMKELKPDRDISWSVLTLLKRGAFKSLWEDGETKLFQWTPRKMGQESSWEGWDFGIAERLLTCT